MKNEKNIRKSLKKLCSAYKTSLKENKGGWLFDNYYVFEREGQSVLQFFSQPKSRGLNEVLNALFDKCNSLFDGNNLNENDIGKMLGEEEMSILSFEYAPIVFKAGILISAGENPSDEKRIEKCVRALHFIDETDFEKLADEYGEKEKMLNNDGVYSSMPPECKSAYRKRIFTLSGKKGVSEKEFIAWLLNGKKHIGFRLFPNRRVKNIGYYFIEVIIAAVCSAFISVILEKPLLFFAFLFPVWQCASLAAVRIEMRKNPPKPILRLEEEKRARKEEEES